MRELDHLKVELSGSNLIEAGAGTGKTYAIACLYLRLLIEKELTPDQILVVTFTEAATEELRGRIRGRIREALDLFSGGFTDDSFLEDLFKNSNEKGPGRERSRDILDLALKSFDIASIFTIHGFCLRALQDNAFESGSLYNTELVTDPSDLLQEAADDFWRMNFFGDQAPLMISALAKGYSPDYFAGFIKKMLDNPKMKIVPDFGSSDLSSLDHDCGNSLEEVSNAWKKYKNEIVNILDTDKGLSRKAGVYKSDLLPELYEGMDSFLAADNPYDLFNGFNKFCTSGILKGTKPTGTAPAHPFFDICERLKSRVEQRLLLLKWDLVEFCRKQITLRKRELNIRFFSDLLNDLYTALYGESGDRFAECLRGKYRAALIDEFQDTDPVQYDIFQKIYAGPEIPLFLIGDPKQAIYSFRGADIFAYMEASGRVESDRRFTLTSNWRSTPRLLDAFNTVFDNEGKPFVYNEIAYHPIKSGKTDSKGGLVLKVEDDAPLQLWTMPPNEDGEPLTVGEANDAVSLAVAAEIARLLQDAAKGKASIKERPVVPGDMAVIVRSHRQAGYLQDALRELCIPSVMRSDQSIFTTNEAREVCTLLAALADPGSEYKVRGALATAILGRSGNDIASLLEDEEAWEKCLEKFRDYHQSWLERGFMVMSQALLAREEVRGRLLRRPDGERRLTNLLHCFEVIHQAGRQKGLGREGLLTWFGEKVSSGEKSEEYQLRLETDEKAVKIVTVHVSKGLEYPIVFCPFMWGGIKTDGDLVTFHENFTMIKDFGSAELESHRILAEKEILAENLRLLYVALTRAQYRCYLVAGKVNGNVKNRPETSPISYLFHAPAEVKTQDDLVAGVAREVKSLSAAELEMQLRNVAGKGKGTISISQMPAAEFQVPYLPSRDEGKPVVLRNFTSAIDRDWRVASFTSFAKHDAAVVELPDRDETGRGAAALELAVASEESKGMSIFTFPRGVQAGIFLHEIFEEIDFSDADEDLVRELVERKREKHGYPADWQPHLCNMVGNVLATPLSSQAGTFQLSNLRKGSWITELEFFFPLKFITSDLLKECIRKWSDSEGSADLLKVCSLMSFRPVSGIVRGFMDMVFEHGGRFYLLDWKSNHLGKRHEDYGKESLGKAMELNLYPLQYLLYTVALNSYLSMRVRGYRYETHFGGVIYVFLRGVSPERGENFSIFRDLPPVGMIEELTRTLVAVGG